MEKKHFINETYQVIDNEILYEGTSEECDKYIKTINFLNGLIKDPEFKMRVDDFVEKITGL